MSTELCLVFVSAPSLERASELGTTLVEEQRCACVNVLPIHQSIYRWEGKVCSDSEALLIIKCAKDSLPALERRVLELHPYDVPEFVAVETTHVSEAYLQWALRSSR